MAAARVGHCVRMPRLRRRETGLLADWIGATPYAGHPRGAGLANALALVWPAAPLREQRRQSQSQRLR